MRLKGSKKFQLKDRERLVSKGFTNPYEKRAQHFPLVVLCFNIRKNISDDSFLPVQNTNIFEDLRLKQA